MSACVHAKSLQSCLILCNPMDYSPPGCCVHGILQARTAGVGCHALLQGIFPIQESNPCLLCLLHWQVSSLSLAPPGKVSGSFCRSNGDLEASPGSPSPLRAELTHGISDLSTGP